MSKSTHDSIASRKRTPALISPRFFKALCDPTRIALLARLAACGEPCSVGCMAACCPVDMSVPVRKELNGHSLRSTGGGRTGAAAPVQLQPLRSEHGRAWPGRLDTSPG